MKCLKNSIVSLFVARPHANPIVEEVIQRPVFLIQPAHSLVWSDRLPSQRSNDRFISVKPKLVRSATLPQLYLHADYNVSDGPNEEQDDSPFYNMPITRCRANICNAVVMNDKQSSQYVHPLPLILVAEANI